MLRYSIQDLFAGAVALLSVGGIVALSIKGDPIPVELGTLVGLAAGWLFRGSPQIARASQTPPPNRP